MTTFSAFVLSSEDYHCHGCDYEGPANVHDLPEEECTPDTNCEVRN